MRVRITLVVLGNYCSPDSYGFVSCFIARSVRRFFCSWSVTFCLSLSFVRKTCEDVIGFETCIHLSLGRNRLLAPLRRPH